MHHGKNFFVLKPFVVETFGIRRIKVETESEAEGDAVLRRHHVFWLIDGVMSHKFFDAGNDNLLNIVEFESDLLAQSLQRLDRRMRIDVASATFDANI